jgi:hypothetical protein
MTIRRLIGSLFQFGLARPPFALPKIASPYATSAGWSKVEASLKGFRVLSERGFDGAGTRPVAAVFGNGSVCTECGGNFAMLHKLFQNAKIKAPWAGHTEEQGASSITVPVSMRLSVRCGQVFVCFLLREETTHRRYGAHDPTMSRMCSQQQKAVQQNRSQST